MHQRMNGDEFMTLIDLITIVLFMSFVFWITFQTCNNLSRRLSIYTATDKVIVTEEQHEKEDPLWFTAYQAYMFAWHMDEMSSQPLSWVTYGMNRKIDDDDFEYDIRMARRYINNSPVSSSFIPIRNRYIVGTGYASESNVKKTINACVSDRLFDFYRGNYENSSGEKLMFHLSLTDKYTRYSSLGTDPNYGGKLFSWVLEPMYH